MGSTSNLRGPRGGALGELLELTDEEEEWSEVAWMLENGDSRGWSKSTFRPCTEPLLSRECWRGS